MNKRWFYLIMILALITLTACQSIYGNAIENEKKSSKRTELTISAAASLSDAFEEIKQKFENEHEDIQITFNFGASGDLQQQISQGAPVDLFISAAMDKFTILKEQSLLDEEFHKKFLVNELVLITPDDSTLNIHTFNDLTKNNVKQLAIGTPESVPVGQYSKQCFEHTGIWDVLQDKLIYAKDVREVLHYVATGNVDAGVVYRTDAMTSDKINVVDTAAAESHEEIIYPIGILKNSRQMAEAIMFYDYLQSDEAKQIFISYGFKVLD